MTGNPASDRTHGNSNTWRVHTVSGASYLLDLDRGVMRRERGVTDISAALRRDGGDVILLKVIECTVGRPMLLEIDLSWPNVMKTTRTSTPVTNIERVRNDDDDIDTSA